MIQKQNILKEQEFKWLIESRDSSVILGFLENKIIFVKDITLNSQDGLTVLIFLKKLPGLVYIEFKKPIDVATNSVTLIYDKIYFQKSEDRLLFTKKFQDQSIMDNIIHLRD